MLIDYLWNIAYKILLEKSLKTMLRNYYHKTDSKKCLQTTIREIIPHNAYTQLSEN